MIKNENVRELLPAEADTPRSASGETEFEHSQPCTATGRPSVACPDSVIDHVRPLGAGGENVEVPDWNCRHGMLKT